MVRRRQAQRLLQLHRPPHPRRPAQQGRHHLGGRARRPAGDDLLGALPRGRPLRQRAQAARHQEGRPGGDLPADGARGGRRHAGLRPHRRGALGGVRRILRGVAARPDQRCRRHCPDHGRRRLPARPVPAAQADGRRGPGGDAVGPALHRAPPAGRGRRPADDRRPRPVVAHAAGRRVAGLQARADGRGGHAVHPLYLGHHREAQGHRPHDGRLSHPRRIHGQARVRPARRGRLLVHRRHRLGHRPFLRGLWPAGERRHGGDVRGRARLARAGPLLAHHRAVRRHRALHGAHRDPRLHEVGRRASPAARPLHAPAPRLRGRADQPRGVDLVSREHRPPQLPDRRHLVADRDRRHHDHAPSRGRDHQARLRHHRLPRHRAGAGGCARA